MGQSQRDARHDDDNVDRSNWYHTQQKLLFFAKFICMENCLMHFWLNYDFVRACTQTAATWTAGVIFIHICGKPLNAALKASVHKISSIENFPFHISLNGQFENGKKHQNSYSCSPVKPSHYFAVHKNGRFSLWSNDGKFHKSKQCLRSG